MRGNGSYLWSGATRMVLQAGHFTFFPANSSLTVNSLSQFSHGNRMLMGSLAVGAQSGLWGIYCARLSVARADPSVVPASPGTRLKAAPQDGSFKSRALAWSGRIVARTRLPLPDSIRMCVCVRRAKSSYHLSITAPAQDESPWR